MKIEKIIEKILEINPEMKRNNIVQKMGGNIEYTCEHDIGHTVYSPNEQYIHGCDNCCIDKKYKILLLKDLKD